MTTSTVQLELQPRELLGKKVGRLRRAGIIPVHLYGAGIDSRALQCNASVLIRALADAGASSPIAVTIEGEPGSHIAFAREIQWEAKRDTVLHVDLLVADVSQPVSAQVPLSLTGEAPGASGGGYVSQLLFEVQVSALPLDMPGQIEIDVSVLQDPNSALRAGDIALPAEVTLETDPEELVARVEAPQAAAEQEPADDE